MSIPSDLLSKWTTLVTKPHADQAVWFLNAFWNGGVKEKAEDVWKWQEKFSTIDPNEGNGYDLDEFWSHKFLEELGETITVLELRQKLREIDVDKNKRMCISEYLLFKFSKAVPDLVDAPQGDPEELEKAQALVEAASKALDEVVTKLEEQKAAAAANAKAEVELKAAKSSLEEALAAVKAEEDAYNNKTADLKAKSEGGGVSGMKAKNELAQHLAEDPLPLRRAKITAEAAVKRNERATKAAAAAKVAAEEAAKQLEVAVKDAEAKRDEALAYLEKVKASGAGAGQVWWLKRGMYEKQKFLPTAKQTMAYPDPCAA